MTNPLLPLTTRGDRIVDTNGQPVDLRGVCLGGWLNMENFINAYPGSEHGLRATMAEVLGPGRARFFFDRLLDHFINDTDIAFIRDQGATVVRVPFNYRHLENDAQPFRYLEAGFAYLDRILECCARHGLYAILDLHAAAGWQNPDWHSDNANRHTLLWDHPHFQDRLVELWAAIAERYVGSPTVAGYNLLNEPVTNAPRGCFSEVSYRPDWPALNRVYRRVVDAIRLRDPHHIIFLEGDFFSSYFSGLEEPFDPYLVYSSHLYTPAGFGPGPYPGEIRGERWDASRQREFIDSHQGTQFARKHQVPLWVGEFGAAYNGPSAEIPGRLRALDDELTLFNHSGLHWTLWTYKDAGVMGWVSLNPECEYLQRLAHVQSAKQQLDTDFWLEWSQPTPAKVQAGALARLIVDTIADPDLKLGEVETYFRQASLANFTGELLQVSYARCFRDLSEVEIDRVLQSFRLENCCIHQDMLAVVRNHLISPGSPGGLHDEL